YGATSAVATTRPKGARPARPRRAELGGGAGGRGTGKGDFSRPLATLIMTRRFGEVPERPIGPVSTNKKPHKTPGNLGFLHFSLHRLPPKTPVSGCSRV